MITANIYSIRKKDRVLYWLCTSIIVLMDSVMPAFTFNSDLAKRGIAHLGYPDYFRIELSVFKIIGGIVLIFPQIPKRVKEWAYVGFALDFISAFIGHFVVDGFNAEAIFPLVMLIILIVSYISFIRMQKIN